MGVAERHAREKEALRKRIIDAASEIFVSEGYQNVSIRKIAEKIEYAPSTIYLYFRDKQQLLESLAIDTFAGLAAELHAIEEQQPDPLKRLELGIRCYIDFGLRHPNHYLATFSGPAPRDDNGEPTESEAVLQIGLQAFGNLRRSIECCMEKGVIRAADPDLTAQSVWMMIHGVTSLLLCADSYPGFPWKSPEELIRHSVELILKGLKG
jgi:AcrR family transcriptional regulator